MEVYERGVCVHVCTHAVNFFKLKVVILRNTIYTHPDEHIKLPGTSYLDHFVQREICTSWWSSHMTA